MRVFFPEKNQNSNKPYTDLPSPRKNQRLDYEMKIIRTRYKPDLRLKNLHTWRKYSDKRGKATLFPHCSMTVKPTVRDQLCSFQPMLRGFSPDEKGRKPKMVDFPEKPQRCAIAIFKNHQIIHLQA